MKAFGRPVFDGTGIRVTLVPSIRSEECENHFCILPLATG